MRAENTSSVAELHFAQNRSVPTFDNSIIAGQVKSAVSIAAPSPIRALFEHFSNVRVVSLAERYDRRALLERDVRRAGLNPRSALRYFDAIRCSDAGPFKKPGSHGCMLSHLAILREGGPVLILQDDCRFLRVALDPISDDTDIFYGSHGAGAPEIIGAHCMGFSARAAALAADYLETTYKRGVPMGHPYPYLPPIDGLLVWFRRDHPELLTEFQYLATQRSSRSDVTPGRLDTIPGIRRLVNFARRYKDDFRLTQWLQPNF